jgi:hypothetical protein
VKKKCNAQRKKNDGRKKFSEWREVVERCVWPAAAAAAAVETARVPWVR